MNAKKYRIVKDVMITLADGSQHTIGPAHKGEREPTVEVDLDGEIYVYDYNEKKWHTIDSVEWLIFNEKRDAIVEI